jgi:hypothetical protein
MASYCKLGGNPRCFQHAPVCFTQTLTVSHQAQRLLRNLWKNQRKSAGKPAGERFPAAYFSFKNGRSISTQLMRASK